jgi:hypothetical protein
MAVVEATIEQQVKALLNNLKDGDPDTTMDEFSNKIATIIKDAILSATITVPVIPVQVAVPSGTGATTAPVTATIT